MKKFFAKIRIWWDKHGLSRRRLIQIYAFLLYNANVKGIISGNIYKGNVKYACVPGLNCYSCPGATGACPLGALQNALGSSNKRAPYFVVGILLLYALMLGRTICGFLCPVGLGQELLYKIRTPKLAKSKVTEIFSYLKYVILLVFVVAIPLAYSGANVAVPAFCKYVCPAGTLGGSVGLLINPSNVSMFDLLGPLFTWKFCLLVVFCVASVFGYRFFCRFFCPLGALYGLFNKFSLLGVTFDTDKCTNCGLCTSKCKMDVRHVGDHECINCGECVSVCPTKAISWKGSEIVLRQNEIAVAPIVTEFMPTAQPEEPSPEPALEPVSENPPATQASPILTKTQKRERTLKIVAWSLALAILLTALVYFNFIDKDPQVEIPDGTDNPGITVGCEVGNFCPTFEVDLLTADGTWNLADTKGKVVIINFWAPWCAPCKEEMPFIEQFFNDHADSLCVIAIDKADGIQSEEIEKQDALDTLLSENWTEFNVTFGIIYQQRIYQMLGGKGPLPLTLILDQEGIVRYNSPQKLSYESLEEIINPLLAAE